MSDKPRIKLKPIEEDTKDNNSVVSYDNIPNYTETNTKKDSDYERIALLSGGKFNDFEYIQIRPFTVKDLIRINHASKSQDFALLVDVLDATIDQDIRKVTVGDFFYLMYWHRINGYSDSPYEINWTSIYGNHNVFTLTRDNIKRQETLLKLSKSEILEYEKLGITSPKIGDYEIINEMGYNYNNETNQERKKELEQQLWLAERAQYLIGDNFVEKMKTIENSNISLLEKIKKFEKESIHGIQESITIYDKKFEPKPAITYLESKLEEIIQSMRDFAVDSLLVEGMNTTKVYRKEVERIKKELKEGKEVKPKSEVIKVTIGYNSFTNYV